MMKLYLSEKAFRQAFDSVLDHAAVSSAAAMS